MQSKIPSNVKGVPKKNIWTVKRSNMRLLAQLCKSPSLKYIGYPGNALDLREGSTWVPTLNASLLQIEWHNLFTAQML